MTPLLKLEREICQWKHPTRETEAEETKVEQTRLLENLNRLQGHTPRDVTR